MSDAENTTPTLSNGPDAEASNETEVSTTTGLTPEQELELLKSKADKMGVKYGPRIGVDTLRSKINAELSGEKSDEKDNDENEGEAPALTANEILAKKRGDMVKKELRMVRCRISNLNPQKKDLAGEIFSVTNKYLGTVKKFIPYGEATDEGYHVPYILFQQLKTRKFQSIQTKTVKGQIQVKRRWVPEFALEEMDPLTQKELASLANSQAAAGGMSE